MKKIGAILFWCVLLLMYTPSLASGSEQRPQGTWFCPWCELAYEVPPEDLNGGPIANFYISVKGILEYKKTVVVIDGEACNSACTLYLAVLPYGQICVARENTVFSFHRPMNYKKDLLRPGKKFAANLSKERRLEFWLHYPAHVRKLLQTKYKSSSGEYWLPRWGHEVTLTAREIGVPECGNLEGLIPIHPEPVS